VGFCGTHIQNLSKFQSDDAEKIKKKYYPLGQWWFCGTHM